jgi:F0F1-type ATP synthase assembly protein I
MNKSGDKVRDNYQSAVTMTVLGVAGSTFLVIFAALFAGLWLDKVFSSKPAFTVGLLLISIPVTLLLMFRVVKAATNRINPSRKNESPEEQEHHGTDS